MKAAEHIYGKLTFIHLQESAPKIAWNRLDERYKSNMAIVLQSLLTAVQKGTQNLAIPLLVMFLNV